MTLVRGRVTDREGRPIAAAAVFCEWTQADSRGGRRGAAFDARTNGLGVFRFPRFGGAPASMIVTASGFRRKELSLEARTSGARGHEDLGTLVLERGRLVRGRVIDRLSRRPVAGVRLVASWSEDASGGRLAERRENATSASDGSFEIGASETRTTTLGACRGDRSHAPSTVFFGPDRDDVEVALGAGGRIEGRVCGDASTLAHSSILIRSVGAFGVGPHPLDASGGFVIESLEPGAHVLTRQWSRPLGERRGRGWVMGAAEIDTLHPPETLTVTVEEGRTTFVTIGCGTSTVALRR